MRFALPLAALAAMLTSDLAFADQSPTSAWDVVISGIETKHPWLTSEQRVIVTSGYLEAINFVSAMNHTTSDGHVMHLFSTTNDTRLTDNSFNKETMMVVVVVAEPGHFFLV
jgi:hypothetical protein